MKLLPNNQAQTTWYCPDTDAEWEVKLDYDHQPEEPMQPNPDHPMFGPGWPEEIVIGDISRLEPRIISGIESGEHWMLWEGFDDGPNGDIDQWQTEILEAIKESNDG